MKLVHAVKEKNFLLMFLSNFCARDFDFFYQCMKKFIANVWMLCDVFECFADDLRVHTSPYFCEM